jgi:hypothetical protein
MFINLNIAYNTQDLIEEKNKMNNIKNNPSNKKKEIDDDILIINKRMNSLETKVYYDILKVSMLKLLEMKNSKKKKIYKVKKANPSVKQSNNTSYILLTISSLTLFILLKKFKIHFKK